MVIAGNERAYVAQAVGDDVENRSRDRERNVLLQPRDPQARRTPHRSAIGSLVAAEHAEQRGLAGPVSADEAHALARVDLNTDAIEKREMSESQ